MQDKKHGFGTLYWSDGSKFVGNWKNGKQNGKGVYYSTDGTKIEGEWVNGKKI